MAQVHKFTNWSGLTIGRVDYHCQASISPLKRLMLDGQCMAFPTPGGHRRIEIEELQRFLRQYGTPLSPDPYIRTLIIDNNASVLSQPP
jgi:hypothetical protein